MGIEVVVDGLTKSFGSHVVWQDVSLSLPAGEVSVMLGPSGTGKTVFLKALVGLVRPDRGSVVVDGIDTASCPERELYQARKLFGVMFQDGALLDSLTVFENLAFPLREHTTMSEREIAAAVHESLAAVGLSNVDDLLPNQLSGGMVKRVSLARAIIMKPVILLCDEPFSGLDPLSVKLVEGLLVHVNRQLQATMIIVSHHIASTMRIADHVVLLLPDGAVEGSPAELRRTTDPRVAGFLDEDGAAFEARA